VNRSRIAAGLVVLSLGALAALWLAYALAAHPLITAVHEGHASATVARLLPVRPDMPLDYNLDRADNVFFTGYRILVGIWTLLVLAWLLATQRLRWPRPRRHHLLTLAGMLLLTLGPTLLSKIFGLLLALIGPGLAAAPPRIIVIPAVRVRLALVALMALSFLAAPYWTTVPSVTAQLAGLAVLVACAIAWASSAAGTLTWRTPSALQWRDAAWIILILAIVNLRALAIDVPWMGDEDYHIMQIVHLCETAVPIWVLTLGAIVWISAAGRLDRPADSRLLVAVVLALATIGGSANPHLGGSLLRYPYLTRWLQGLMTQGLYPLERAFYQEPLFRMLPFLSVCALGVIVTASLRDVPRALRIGFGVAVATIPTLLYYTSTLALELPALVAMTAVGFAAVPLLRAPSEQVRAHPAWIALVAVGFIKETVVPFLGAVVACRLLLALPRLRMRRTWSEEARFAGATLAPLAIYIVYRRMGSVFREYGGTLQNAFDVSLWQTLGVSYWEQFGPLAVLALLGVVIACRRRENRPAILLALAVTAAGALFFVVDEAQYIGFSRYNLVVVPALICSATWGFAWLARHTRTAAALVVCILAGANVWLSPLYRDGSKQPGWGGSAANVAEQYYPYREAMRWLHVHHHDQRVFFAGLGYPYYHQFYFQQLQWHPRGRISEAKGSRADAVREAIASGCDLAVYPVPTDEREPEAGARDGLRIQEFRNRAHRIEIVGTAMPLGAHP